MDSDKQASYCSLIKMAQTITSSLSDEKILQIILQETISVLPSADAGFFYLYSDEQQKLFLRAHAGFSQGYDEQHTIFLEVGEGISGKTFALGQGRILNGREKVIQESADMQPDHMNNYLHLTAHQDFPRDVISTVLKAQGQILGVLTIDNFNAETDFDEDDLELLQAAADHAAVVIVQVQLLQREQKHLQELEQLTQQLHVQHSALEQTLSIHNQLLNIALQNQGFDQVISFLSWSIGCPLVIYNLYLDILAASRQGEDKELPERLMESSSMKALLCDWQKQIIPLPESGEILYLVPLSGGNKLLGFIALWLQDREQLSQLESVVLNYGAMLLSLECLKQDAVLETSQKLKGEFIQGILRGNLDNSLVQQSRQLGFDDEDYFCVLLVKRSANDSKSGFIQELSNSQLMHSIIDLLQLMKIKSMVNRDKEFYCLLLAFDSQAVKNVADSLYKLTERLLQMQPQLQISVGRLYQGLQQVRISYRESKQCQILSDKYALRSRLINYEALGFLRLVLNSGDNEINAYIKDVLLPVMEHDHKKGSSLFKTLLFYVRCNKSLNAVAEEMHVHNNTVYSRIKRIEDLLKVDFDDTQQWINIQVACTVYELIEPKLEDLLRS
ncbi:MAG: helix-turn-helix domain-containing protein [Clostridiales bacterium]